MPVNGERKDIFVALQRIRSTFRRRKQRDPQSFGNRDIRLGLDRVARAIPRNLPWQGIHVAGTNGKGSICAYLSGMLRLAGVSHGVFSSPAFPEPHNAVLINGRFVDKRLYDHAKERVETRFRRASITRWMRDFNEDTDHLSPFELETAAAFEALNYMRVKYGIIEVGMGGHGDATNIMKSKAVTVISKIGLDHQEYLGNSLVQIALVKAGIMRKGVPCVVDSSNNASVIQALKDQAERVGTRIFFSEQAKPALEGLDTNKFSLEPFQEENLLCALQAFRQVCPNVSIDVNRLLGTSRWLPGRLEKVSISTFTAGVRHEDILVDGAHNLLGIQSLASHVDTKLREGDKPVTWVLGFSASKDKPFTEMIENLVKPQDNVAFVEYVPQSNDPEPVPAELGHDFLKTYLNKPEQLHMDYPSIAEAIQWASQKSADGPLVVAGSLYLVRDLFQIPNIDSRHRPGTRRPGRGQLWHFINTANKRSLTEDEERQFKRARRHWYLAPVRNPVFRNPRGESKESLEVPTKISRAQRAAAHHKTHADQYGAALTAVQRDIAAEESDAAKDDTPDPGTMSVLRDNESKYASQRRMHLAALHKAMMTVRGHAALPGEKWFGKEKVFRWPVRKIDPERSPYMDYEDPVARIQNEEQARQTQQALEAEQAEQAEQASSRNG